MRAEWFDEIVRKLCAKVVETDRAKQIGRHYVSRFLVADVAGQRVSGGLVDDPGLRTEVGATAGNAPDLVQLAAVGGHTPLTITLEPTREALLLRKPRGPLPPFEQAVVASCLDATLPGAWRDPAIDQAVLASEDFRYVIDLERTTAEPIGPAWAREPAHWLAAYRATALLASRATQLAARWHEVAQALGGLATDVDGVWTLDGRSRLTVQVGPVEILLQPECVAAPTYRVYTRASVAHQDAGAGDFTLKTRRMLYLQEPFAPRGGEPDSDPGGFALHADRPGPAASLLDEPDLRAALLAVRPARVEASAGRVTVWVDWHAPDEQRVRAVAELTARLAGIQLGHGQRQGPYR